MPDILDIHTHHSAPQPQAIINKRIGVDDLDLLPYQLYSAGVHPWDVNSTNPSLDILSLPNIVAIGECGIDLTANNAPLFIQLQILKKQIEISEKLRKPMIIHAVKSTDIMCGLRRDIKPTMPWCIHGFRGKPQAAMQLVKAGCYISFGEKFNSETLLAVPEDRILAETDESPLNIQEIIQLLSKVKGIDLTSLIKENSKKFLNFEG